jgi:hypothetical protein
VLDEEVWRNDGNVLTYRLSLVWSLAFHLYSVPLCLNLRDLQKKSDFLSDYPVLGSQDVRARLVYDLTIIFDGQLHGPSCEPSLQRVRSRESHLAPIQSNCATEGRGPLDMPNAIPLASVMVLLGKDGHPDGHSTVGVLKLELKNIGQQRSADSGCGTYTIKFRIFFRFGVVFVDGDGASILVIFGNRIDELESESRRAGHNREDVGERCMGTTAGGEESRGMLFYRRRNMVYANEAREMKTE